MTLEVTNIKIDRSQKSEVDKHIKNVFVKLQKKKTEKLLAAYYQWYKLKPELASKDLIEFDIIPRKSKEDLAKSKTKKTAETVYGDKFAAVLTRFVKANRSHESELIRIAEELKDLAKFEGRNNLGFCRTLSSKEIDLLKDVFKLLRSDTGIVTVAALSMRKKKSAEKVYIKAVPKPNMTVTVEKAEPTETEIPNLTPQSGFEASTNILEYSHSGSSLKAVIHTQKSGASVDKKFETSNCKAGEDEDEAFLHLPKGMLEDLTSKIEVLALTARTIGEYY